MDRECRVCNYRWESARPKSTTTGDGINRRRHGRLPIELRLIYSSSELEIEATTRDLSVSGVFVCTQVLDQLGTRCALTILIDGGPPLEIQGVVRRVVERTDGGEAIGLGIQFVELDDDHRAWIELTVTRMAAADTDRIS